MRRRLIAGVTSTPIELLAGVTLAVLAWLYAAGYAPGAAQITLLPSQSLTLLGFVGGILALVSSLSFSHLLHHMGSASSRKRDAYHQLQNRLYELDSYLRTKPQHLRLVNATQAFSFELKKLRLRDYPVLDWEERIAPVIECLEDEVPPEHVHLPNEILMRLNTAEGLISTIGVMSIRQIVAGVIAKPFIKSLLIISFLLLAGIMVAFIPMFPSLESALLAVPVFFATVGSLLCVEVAWYVHRETEELLDFVADEEG